MSKKIIVLLSCLALAGTLQAANLLVNGDIEQLPGGTGWTQWWGGNSNRYVDDPVESGDHCAGVWWHDDGIYQEVPIGPGVYEFGGKLLTTQGMANRLGVIRADVKDSLGNIFWSQEFQLVPGDAINTWYPNKAAAGFPNSAIIDNSIAGATYIRINLMMANTGTPPSGIVFYDDLYLGPLGIRKQAKFPHPYNTEVGVSAVDPVLRWTNAEPNNPADTVTSDVFLGTAPASLSKIADDITAESVALSALVPPVSLLPNTQYYWRVDCTDPHGDPNAPYGPVTTTGEVWTFTTTNDNPPTVEAGNNQYIWLDMADGDGDPAKVTFNLTGVVGDDGKSPVTLLWALTYSEQDPATLVNIVTPNAAVTSVNINGTGLYTFTLTADDAFGHAEDTVTVIVYGSACEAAQGDPADMPTKYPSGHGDIDGDCDTDLADLSILAGSWIDCMSPKLGC